MFTALLCMRMIVQIMHSLHDLPHDLQQQVTPGPMHTVVSGSDSLLVRTSPPWQSPLACSLASALLPLPQSLTCMLLVNHAHQNLYVQTRPILALRQIDCLGLSPHLITRR